MQIDERSLLEVVQIRLDEKPDDHRLLVVLENIYKLIIGFAEKHALDHQGDILAVAIVVLDVFLEHRRFPATFGRLPFRCKRF